MRFKAKNINKKEIELKLLKSQLRLRQWTRGGQLTVILWDRIISFGVAMAQGPLLYKTFSLNVKHSWKNINVIHFWVQELQCMSVIRNCAK